VPSGVRPGENIQRWHEIAGDPISGLQQNAHCSSPFRRCFLGAGRKPRSKRSLSRPKGNQQTALNIPLSRCAGQLIRGKSRTSIMIGPVAIPRDGGAAFFASAHEESSLYKKERKSATIIVSSRLFAVALVFEVSRWGCSREAPRADRDPHLAQYAYRIH